MSIKYHLFHFLILTAFSLFVSQKENQRLYPYIGGGLGIGFTNIEIITSLQGGPPATTSVLDGDDTVFVGHITTGLTYRASNKVDFYSEARYFRAFDVTISQSTPFFTEVW